MCCIKLCRNTKWSFDPIARSTHHIFTAPPTTVFFSLLGRFVLCLEPFEVVSRVKTFGFHGKTNLLIFFANQMFTNTSFCIDRYTNTNIIWKLTMLQHRIRKKNHNACRLLSRLLWVQLCDKSYLLFSNFFIRFASYR